MSKYNSAISQIFCELSWRKLISSCMKKSSARHPQAAHQIWAILWEDTSAITKSKAGEEEPGITVHFKNPVSTNINESIPKKSMNHIIFLL